MSLNPALRLMVADAQAKYEGDTDPLEAKRAEILARQKTDEEQFQQDMGAIEPSVMERLVILGLRKASKRELRQIIIGAMAADL